MVALVIVPPLDAIQLYITAPFALLGLHVNVTGPSHVSQSFSEITADSFPTETEIEEPAEHPVESVATQLYIPDLEATIVWEKMDPTIAPPVVVQTYEIDPVHPVVAQVNVIGEHELVDGEAVIDDWIEELEMVIESDPGQLLAPVAVQVYVPVDAA